MGRIYEVTAASAYTFNLSFPGLGDKILILASGTTRTSGWTNIRLAPRFYVSPPQDGIWDFDFVGDEPIGVVIEVISPVHAAGDSTAPPWLKGVRVHAETNSVDAIVHRATPTVLTPRVSPAKVRGAAPRGVVYRQEIASYDDSFQPTGMCSLVSVRMKKLHHVLTLTIEGPDAGKAQNCVAQAAGAGLIAAIVAAYVTGGVALQAAVSAFLAALEACLGGEFTARIDDASHWIEWCT